MGLILTKDDLEREVQIDRCKGAIYEYFNGKALLIDYSALFKKLEPEPLLFQFAHMIAFLKYDWKDALRWVHDHREEIFHHAKEQARIKHEQDADATAQANGKANGNDVGAAHQGQPLYVGDDGVSLERAQDPPRGDKWSS